MYQLFIVTEQHPRVPSIQVGEFFLCLISINYPTRFARRGIKWLLFLLKVFVKFCGATLFPKRNDQTVKSRSYSWLKRSILPKFLIPWGQVWVPLLLSWKHLDNDKIEILVPILQVAIEKNLSGIFSVWHHHCRNLEKVKNTVKIRILDTLIPDSFEYQTFKW